MTIRDDFIAFLKAAPDTVCSFCSARSCFLQQFGQSLHPDKVVLGGAEEFYIEGENKRTSRVIVLNQDNSDFRNLLYANTFGQAASNLEKRLY